MGGDSMAASAMDTEKESDLHPHPHPHPHPSDEASLSEAFQDVAITGGYAGAVTAKDVSITAPPVIESDEPVCDPIDIGLPVEAPPAHDTANPRCQCGCVPPVKSLFEMARLRKQLREQQRHRK
eukprot:gnl/MRDRNA2_/MRDRNA2_141600_c0_seq1.p1 gnl/MRDRNA2_/MRDRNA2_141600_c0~~gnl/MRDRNA2_/MRDRNA2_141600_c0_seq1.p1  ORF type:complete len:124 (-),score=21.13 gnl/MRDRNA2_/MRDRNA2_141600_c0_seq1:5-376(-)